MTLTTKIIIIVSCILLCAGGIILNSRQSAKDSMPKSEVAPVINRQPRESIWLRV
jgi:hypothetical protein